jgi:predicted MFS family arabinose efflux permease
LKIKHKLGEAWGPLAQPVFRSLWLASVASNIGTWMHNVGAAWLMTSLTQSPLLIALLTTMGSLPIFLVGLPAGALADVLDRRRIVLLAQIWMLAVAAVVGVLAFTGFISPWMLLGLTFLLSLGGALSLPAWQALMPELVGKEQLASAIALNGAGFNLARAVGPALGGVIVAAAGAGAVFALNALSFIVIIGVILRWKRSNLEAPAIPEPVVSAIQAGGRYALHARELRAVLVRTAAAIIGGSALWALLPVIASQELHLSALGYGMLLGSVGVGAVGGVPLLTRLRARFSLDVIVTTMTIVLALTTLALGYIHDLWLLNAAMLITGAAWLVLTSCLNVAAQTIVPAWVQARALGVYLLVFQGCFAAGAAGWGALAGRVGNAETLLFAALALAASTITALRWHLRTGEDLDLRPSGHIPMPETVVEPAPENGPVLVQIAYQIRQAEQDNFVQALEDVRLIRLRDGAFRWDVFCDPTEPGRYVETFEIASWAEYLRQHERATVVDQEVEARAQAYQEPGTEPSITHLVSARSMSAAQPPPS